MRTHTHGDQTTFLGSESESLSAFHSHAPARHPAQLTTSLLLPLFSRFLKPQTAGNSLPRLTNPELALALFQGDVIDSGAATLAPESRRPGDGRRDSATLSDRLTLTPTESTFHSADIIDSIIVCGVQGVTLTPSPTRASAPAKAITWLMCDSDSRAIPRRGP